MAVYRALRYGKQTIGLGGANGVGSPETKQSSTENVGETRETIEVKG